MTEPFEDIVDVALLVAAAIESCGGEYFVGGSLASSVDGEPRATNDIDIVMDLPLDRVRDLRLDHDYTRRWSSRSGVDDLLDRALRDAAR